MYGWNSLQVRAHHAQKPLRSISPHLRQTVMGYVDSDRSIKPAKRVNNSGHWLVSGVKESSSCLRYQLGSSNIQRASQVDENEENG